MISGQETEPSEQAETPQFPPNNADTPRLKFKDLQWCPAVMPVMRVGNREMR